MFLNEKTWASINGVDSVRDSWSLVCNVHITYYICSPFYSNHRGLDACNAFSRKIASWVCWGKTISCTHFLWINCCFLSMAKFDALFISYKSTALIVISCYIISKFELHSMVVLQTTNETIESHFCAATKKQNQILSINRIYCGSFHWSLVNEARKAAQLRLIAENERSIN